MNIYTYELHKDRIVYYKILSVYIYIALYVYDMYNKRKYL